MLRDLMGLQCHFRRVLLNDKFSGQPLPAGTGGRGLGNRFQRVGFGSEWFREGAAGSVHQYSSQKCPRAAKASFTGGAGAACRAAARTLHSLHSLLHGLGRLELILGLSASSAFLRCCPICPLPV